MSEKKKPNEEKYFIRCLRCDHKSQVAGVAKCKHCGSYAVRFIVKKRR